MTLTHEDQRRIEIAKLLCHDLLLGDTVYKIFEGKISWRVPDYENDLNQMHDIENRMDDKSRRNYRRILKKICKDSGFELYRASSKTRAQAFLELHEK